MRETHHSTARSRSCGARRAVARAICLLLAIAAPMSAATPGADGGEFVMHKNQPAPERLNFANHLWNSNRGWSLGEAFDRRRLLAVDDGGLDRLGYPVLAPGDRATTALVVDERYPNSGMLKGRMTITWRGDAEVLVGPGATVVESVPRRLEIDVSASFPLTITAGPDYASDPLRHLRVWVPDAEAPSQRSLAPQPGEREPVINPAYVEAWQIPGVGVWRMAFAQFNDNPQETWEHTRHPDHCFMLGSVGSHPVPGRDGRREPMGEVAWPQCIALANALGVDLWLMVPHGAHDSYVRHLARLVLFGADADGMPYAEPQADPVYPPLDPEHRVWIELSNELWHPGFHQGIWAIKLGESLGISNGSVVGRRAAEMWSLFQDEFDRAGVSWRERLVRVGSGSDNRYEFTRDFIVAAQTHGAALPDLRPEATIGGGRYPQPTAPDVIDNANYFGNNIDAFVVEMSAHGSEHPWWDASDAPIAAVEREWQRRLIGGSGGSDWVNSASGTVEPRWMALAAEHRLPVVGYEGGMSGNTRREFSIRYPEVRAVDKDRRREPGVETAPLTEHAKRVAQRSGAPGHALKAFEDFLRFRFMESPAMTRVMRLQLEMLKAQGVRMPANTSEIDNPGSRYDWGLTEYLGEPLAEAPRLRAVREFVADHRDLNEVGERTGRGAPRFSTPTSLIAYRGEAVAPITLAADGGDGTLRIRTFGWWLPGELHFDETTNTISGTATQGERGLVFARVQDEDGDIAYATFRIDLLDPSLGRPLWRETFDDLADGSTGDDGETAWTVSMEGDEMVGTCGVRSGQFEAVGVKAEKGSAECIWRSQPIDISGHDSVNLLVRPRSNDEVDRGGDWLRISYRIDGGDPVPVADFSGESATIAADAIVTAEGLRGSELVVEVRMTNSNIERYALDEVCVLVP